MIGLGSDKNDNKPQDWHLSRRFKRNCFEFKTFFKLKYLYLFEASLFLENLFCEFHLCPPSSSDTILTFKAWFGWIQVTLSRNYNIIILRDSSIQITGWPLTLSPALSDHPGLPRVRPGGHQGDQVVTKVIRWSPRSPRWFSLTGLSRKQKEAEVMLRFEVLSFFTLDCRVFWKGALSKVGSSLQCRLGWFLRKADNLWLASCKQAMGGWGHYHLWNFSPNWQINEDWVALEGM